MFARHLRIFNLPDRPPEGPLIESSWFEQQDENAKRLRAVEIQAVGILSSARRKAKKILRQAAKHQRHMKNELVLERARLGEEVLKNSESRWIKQHIRCLLKDAELEKGIIKEVADRIQISIEQVVGSWLGKQPLDETLCSRLAVQVEKMATRGALTLHLHPILVPRARRLWGEILTITPAPNFSRDYAVLSSIQYSVSIDLNRHLSTLLAWLRKPDKLTGEYDDYHRYDDFVIPEDIGSDAVMASEE